MLGCLRNLQTNSNWRAPKVLSLILALTLVHFLSVKAQAADPGGSLGAAMSRASDYVNRHVPGGRKITQNFKTAKNVVLSWELNFEERTYADSSTVNDVLTKLSRNYDQRLAPSPPLTPNIPAVWGFEMINMPVARQEMPFFMEGVWYPVRTYTSRPQDMLVWYTRLFESKKSQYVEIFAYDLSKISLGYCSGDENVYLANTKAGATFVPRYHKGCTKIPFPVVAQGGLLSAFRGGFMLDDGLTLDKQTFGVVSQGVAEVPPTAGLLGLGVLKNGSVVLEPYNPKRPYTSFRQNGSPILLGGNVTSLAMAEKIYFADRDKGAFSEASEQTPRQGVSISKNKRWLFIARSMDTTSKYLAKALATAGGQDGLLLDMHLTDLTAHIVYQYDGGNNVIPYAGYDTKGLVQDKSESWDRFKFGHEERDFFYVFKK